MEKIIDLSSGGNDEAKNISVRIDIDLLDRIDQEIALGIINKNKNIPKNRSQWIIKAIKKSLEE